MGNCFTVLIIIAVILTAVCLVWCEPLLTFFGASPDTLNYGAQYLRIYACGTLFVQLSLGMNAFITTQGFSTTSMCTTLIGAILNILLDPLFIFVFQMGVQGAALATVLSQCVSTLWVLRFLLGKRTVLKLRRKYLMPDPRALFPCLALGVAPFTMQSTESLIAVCFNTSLLRYGGDTAVGAMTILTSMMQFSMMPLTGLSQGAQPIISYNYGAKNLNRVRQAFLYLLFSSLAFSVALRGAIMLFPQVFASWFTSDTTLIPMTVWAMRIYMAASFLFGIQIPCQQTFIALSNAKASVFLALLRKIVLLIPLIYILLHFFENKLFAVFFSEPLADTLAVLVTATMFSSTFRKLGQGKCLPGASV